MMTNLLRFDFNDRDGIFEVVENGDWVRATDYDALAAKLAEAERVARYETDIAQQALDQMKAEKARADLATPLDDPRVKALVEALRDMTALAIQLGAIDLETRDALAALSALEENK